MCLFLYEHRTDGPFSFSTILHRQYPKIQLYDEIYFFNSRVLEIFLVRQSSIYMFVVGSHLTFSTQRIYLVSCFKWSTWTATFKSTNQKGGKEWLTEQVSWGHRVDRHHEGESDANGRWDSNQSHQLGCFGKVRDCIGGCQSWWHQSLAQPHWLYSQQFDQVGAQANLQSIKIEIEAMTYIFRNL